MLLGFCSLYFPERNDDAMKRFVCLFVLLSLLSAPALAQEDAGRYFSGLKNEELIELLLS